MPREKLFLLWEDMVREKELPVLNPTSALEGALTIRYDVSAVYWRWVYVPNYARRSCPVAFSGAPVANFSR